jgi:hypothetical protein
MRLEPALDIRLRSALDVPPHLPSSVTAAIEMLEAAVDLRDTRDRTPPPDDDGRLRSRLQQDIARIKHELAVLRFAITPHGGRLRRIALECPAIARVEETLILPLAKRRVAPISNPTTLANEPLPSRRAQEVPDRTVTVRVRHGIGELWIDLEVVLETPAQIFGRGA